MECGQAAKAPEKLTDSLGVDEATNYIFELRLILRAEAFQVLLDEFGEVLRLFADLLSFCAEGADTEELGLPRLANILLELKEVCHSFDE